VVDVIMWCWLTRSTWVFDIGLRRMNEERPPGWAVLMGVFSGLALALMTAANFRLPFGLVFSVAAAVGLLIAERFSHWPVRQIWRLGLRGPTRARWWVELAALTWTLCFCGGLFWLAHGIGAAALPGVIELIVSAVATGTKYLFAAFFGFALAGYVLGALQQKRLRGRSVELVNWFFWTIVGSQLLAAIPWDFGPVAWVAPVLAIVGVAAGCVAAILAAYQHWIRATPTER
jgi:hypothetical protein